MKSRLTDQAIVAGILEGGRAEERALQDLYVANRAGILAFIKKNQGEEAEAKDVLQDAIVACYDNIKTGKFKGQSTIRSYLYSIARFIWLNRLKRKQREIQLLEQESIVDIQEDHLSVLLEGEKEQQVRELFAKLGSQCSDLLIDAIYYNYSMKEIAERMTYENEQVVRNKKYKCLKRLKELLEQQPQLKQWLRDL